MLPDKTKWTESFLNDEFYQKLDDYASYILTYKKSLKTEIGFSPEEDIKVTSNVSPREINLILYKVFYLDFLYMVDYIRTQNNKTIYDIGCGSNMIKFFFDEIIGIDPHHPAADIIDKFNKSFVMRNKNKFPNAVAIDSIHFIPLTRFREQLLDFASCIMKNGYGYARFNINHLLIRENIKNIPNDIKQYIHDEIEASNLNILYLNVHRAHMSFKQVIRAKLTNGMIGSISILFKVT